GCLSAITRVSCDSPTSRMRASVRWLHPRLINSAEMSCPGDCASIVAVRVHHCFGEAGARRASIVFMVCACCTPSLYVRLHQYDIQSRGLVVALLNLDQNRFGLILRVAVASMRASHRENSLKKIRRRSG